MLIEPVPCSKGGCKHYQGVRQPDGTEETEVQVCEAFSDGIPEEIATGQNMHTLPYEGDNGIRYEREKPPDSETAAAEMLAGLYAGRGPNWETMHALRAALDAALKR